MFDPVSLAVMAGMAGINAMNANQQQADTKRFNQGQAEMTKYSPWTGRAGEIQRHQGPSPLMAGVGGAAQGAGLAQQFGSAKPQVEPMKMDPKIADVKRGTIFEGDVFQPTMFSGGPMGTQSPTPMSNAPNKQYTWDKLDLEKPRLLAGRSNW